jgi:hypothetical protein
MKENHFDGCDYKYNYGLSSVDVYRPTGIHIATLLRTSAWAIEKMYIVEGVNLIKVQYVHV